MALELARASPPQEAKLRSAVSRAYYAAFLTAQRRLGLILTSAYPHAELVNAVRKRRHALGDQLDFLRRQRAKADYELEVKNWEHIWPDVERYTNHILPKLRLL